MEIDLSKPDKCTLCEIECVAFKGISGRFEISSIPRKETRYVEKSILDCPIVRKTKPNSLEIK